MTSGTDNKIILEINTQPNIIHTKDEETQKNIESPTQKNNI